MIGKNKAVLVAILLALFLAGLLVGLLWLFEWYRLEPLWFLLLEVAAVLAVTVLGGATCFYLLTRPKIDPDQKQKEEWRSRTIRSRFTQIWKKHSRIASDPYQLPWYLHLSADSGDDLRWLQQMGFESVDSPEAVPEDLVAVSFWVSDFAIVVSVDMNQPNDSRSESLQILYDLIMKKRARQAFNGVVCAVNLGSLIERNEIAVNELSLEYRRLMAEFNQNTGLSLPVYCVFTHMSQVRDFCELFSTLDESRREQPFGALRPLEEGRGYDKEWFDNSFDDLTRRLSVTLSACLKQQLNAEYRDASVAGLFQLAALRYDVEDFLSLSFSQHQFDNEELFFRGYFFINAGGEATSTDLMTAMHASDLGFDSLPEGRKPSSGLSLFGKSLFRSCIVKESPLVGVYRRKEWWYRFSRLAVSGGLLALFVGFLLTLKAGFDYQQALDARALAMLDSYKENLEHNAIQPDDLSSPVFSLSELRDIYQLYRREEHPWYISEWLPDSSIEEYVRDAYFRELNSELLTLMRDYILKDMFVYNSLDDKVKTLELLNFQQILYNPQRTSVQPLVDYYTSALVEEGKGDADLLQRFSMLALDVLNTDAVPPEFDPELLALVRSSLSSEDVSELLYQHILQHTDFARRVDIRDKLNPSYEALFRFKEGFSGYLVPYLFTRQGFEDLNNETGFQLASEAIKAYQGVMGRISGNAEMNRINRQLRERYISDYIRYWKGITSNVIWSGAETWGESSVQLELATDANFSPLVQFYWLVDAHTNLLATEKPKVEKQQESSDPAETSSDTIERVAKSISVPFGAIHKLVATGDSGQSRLDIALMHLRQLHAWVAKSKEMQQRGYYFLEQLQNTDAANPIAQLRSLAEDYDDSLLPILLRGQAEVANQLALDSMRSVINQEWSGVSGYYQQRLSGHYPFEKDSAVDASLSDFEEFFKPGGRFDRFAGKYAVYFEESGSTTLLKGFIPHEYLALSQFYKPFTDLVVILQSGLFSTDKLGFEFLVRAQRMSPALTGFALESGLKLFEYQNGPTLWRKQSWPLPSNQEQDITIVTKDVAGVVAREKVSGEWSWFRVADRMKGATLVGSEHLSWRFISGEHEISLKVKAKGKELPFSPLFFTKMKLPLTL